MIIPKVLKGYFSKNMLDTIIADESGKIANPQTKTYKAMCRLKANRRIALNGTPIMNRAQDVWGQINWTNPGVLGNYYSFLGRYCLKNQWGGIFGYRNMDELRERIRRYMIRRQKVDVLPELPAKIETDIPFVLSEEEKQLYSRLKKEILFEIEHEDISKLENPMTIQYTLTKLTRLRQLADSMELIGKKSKSSKMEVLHELLEELSADGHKIIIFSEFSEMCKIIQRETNSLLIIGETPNHERHKIVDSFTKDNEKKLLVMSSAGMFGLNLQSSDVIIHYDQPWSLAKKVQREGRAHRIGQKKSVSIYSLLGKTTVDYYVKKVLHAKAELSNQILGDTPISMEQIQEMLHYEE